MAFRLACGTAVAAYTFPSLDALKERTPTVLCIDFGLSLLDTPARAGEHRQSQHKKRDVAWCGLVVPHTLLRVHNEHGTARQSFSSLLDLDQAGIIHDE